MDAHETCSCAVPRRPSALGRLDLGNELERESMPAQPFLKIGSKGEPVRILQKALNLAPTILPRLTEDGDFGGKTHGRVCEFQGKSGLVADGLVGPNTYAALKEWLDLIVPSIVSPADEAKARDRILQVATQSQQTLGWRPGQDQFGLANQRIAASHSATLTTMKNSPVERAPRQGGTALAAIFTTAGVSTAQKCLEINGLAWNMYRTPGLPDNWRNTYDIPSWCGIFALYVHKWAGLKVREWPLRFWSKDGADDYRVLSASELPRPGDIGRVKSANHFFIVMEAPSNKQSSFATVEGNSNIITPEGVFQTIRANRRTVADVYADEGGFLAPIWERVLPTSPQSSSTEKVGTGTVQAPSPIRFSIAR
ncbi:MAG: peptidoglycan-binding protein [Candidatus Eisenbacteria bacterium]|nr:peptidoglycan-binding protein [Candidatus Eisenbacteria bacterium]